MGTRKIVPLRPRQQEGPAKPPKALTLADIAIVWTDPGPARRTRHITGDILARLVAQLAYRTTNPSSHALEPEMVPLYLRGMSYLVYPDAGAPNEQIESDVRFTVSDFLHHAAALLHADHAEPKDYRVHVGPIPEEWK